MSEFVLPTADGRMYAFHIKNAGFEGIELYTRKERGMRLAQACYGPDIIQNIDFCMIAGKKHGISEVYTIKNLEDIQFSYPIERSALEEAEVIEFAKRGLKVIVLDKINQ